jgi:small-conductance mechanosensitive channel
LRILKVNLAKSWLLILIGVVVVLFVSWIALRFFLTTTFSMSTEVARFIDVTLTFAVGIVAIVLISKLISRYVTAYVGPAQGNIVKLLFYVAGFSILLLVAFSVSGADIGNILLGAGFLGIVIGLAAQTVLGNFFAGLMLLASRPFHIGDRVALINWQYGKFPPSLSHGWLEPAYTGYIKEITLIYTKIFTDSSVLVTVPNGVAMQSLILNLSHDKKQSYISSQLEVPINVDPDVLHKKLAAQLSTMQGFSGKEESFEILEVSPSAYLLALSYSIAPKTEREMKTILFKAYRLALTNSTSKNETP